MVLIISWEKFAHTRTHIFAPRQNGFSTSLCIEIMNIVFGLFGKFKIRRAAMCLKCLSSKLLTLDVVCIVYERCKVIILTLLTS